MFNNSYLTPSLKYQFKDEKWCRKWQVLLHPFNGACFLNDFITTDFESLMLETFSSNFLNMTNGLTYTLKAGLFQHGSFIRNNKMVEISIKVDQIFHFQHEVMVIDVVGKGGCVSYPWNGHQSDDSCTYEKVLVLREDGTVNNDNVNNLI